VERAIELLTLLDCLEEGAITQLGQQIAELPVHPRVGRLLLEGAKRGCLGRAATAAALLSERDPFLRQQAAGPRMRTQVGASDVATRVQAIEQFAANGAVNSPVGALNSQAARSVLRVREQLLRLVPKEKREGEAPAESSAGLLHSLLAAFPDRLVRRRASGSERGLMVGGRGVVLDPASEVRDAELFLAIVMDGGESEGRVRQASAVQRDWLEASHLVRAVEVYFDEASEKVVARARTRWQDLTLEETSAPLPSDDTVASALASAALATWPRAFPAQNEELASFLARARCLASWLPELELPPLSEEQLKSLLPDLCLGRRSFAELRQAPWLAAVKGLFTYPQLQAIEQEAPERIEVPSGSRIALDYEPGQPPILKVRIQELFGLAATPRIARGRVGVLLHLLAPNMRPEQITPDLASFWKNTYPQVRRDLRGRYPKHSWPEDPLMAEPLRGVKRRGERK
jgi:ATP-dependent helicase HrpB